MKSEPSHLPDTKVEETVAKPASGCRPSWFPSNSQQATQQKHPRGRVRTLTTAERESLFVPPEAVASCFRRCRIRPFPKDRTHALDQQYLLQGLAVPPPSRELLPGEETSSRRQLQNPELHRSAPGLPALF